MHVYYIHVLTYICFSVTVVVLYILVVYVHYNFTFQALFLYTQNIQFTYFDVCYF